MADIIDWRKIKNGDKAEYDKMFDYYYNPLCSFAYSYLKNAHIVEDIIVDVFAHIWEKRSSLDIKSSLKNYLLTLAKNFTVNYIRQNKIQFVDIGNLTEITEEDDFQYLENIEIQKKLEDLINDLPDQRRIVLKMAVFEGKTYKEIAEELGVTVNTIKTQMSRSYKYLKENLSLSESKITTFLFFV